MKWGWKGKKLLKQWARRLPHFLPALLHPRPTKGSLLPGGTALKWSIQHVLNAYYTCRWIKWVSKSLRKALKSDFRMLTHNLISWLFSSAAHLRKSCHLKINPIQLSFPREQPHLPRRRICYILYVTTAQSCEGKPGLLSNLTTVKLVQAALCTLGQGVGEYCLHPAAPSSGVKTAKHRSCDHTAKPCHQGGSFLGKL